MKTGILVHGYSLNEKDAGEKDWVERMFGVPPFQLGRATRAVHLLATEYPETKMMLFGSGASEIGGEKEGDYIIRYLLENFDELAKFEQFMGIKGGWFSSPFDELKQKVGKIAQSETKSHNTKTELLHGIPRFLAAGIHRIVLVSEFTHFTRCGVHAGEILEELGLEHDVEITLKHSFYRPPAQKLSGVRIVQPEIRPEAGIQMGDLVSQLFKVKKGNRRDFAAEYEALIAKYSS